MRISTPLRLCIGLGATNTSAVTSALTAKFGAQAPLVVVQANGGPIPKSRYWENEQLLAGDAIWGGGYECTAGFGAWEPGDKKPNGERELRHFLLTAGHCFVDFGGGKEVFRLRPPGSHAKPYEDYLGHVARQGLPGNGLHATGGWETDAEAIKLENEANVPRWIYVTNWYSQRVTGIEEVKAGMTVCFSGVSSNRTLCGPIIGDPVEGEFYDPEESLVTGPMWHIPFKNPIAGTENGVPVYSIEGNSGSPIWNPYTANAVGLLSSEDSYHQFNEFTPLAPVPGRSASEGPGALAALGFTSEKLIFAR